MKVRVQLSTVQHKILNYSVRGLLAPMLYHWPYVPVPYNACITCILHERWEKEIADYDTNVIC